MTEALDAVTTADETLHPLGEFVSRNPAVAIAIEGHQAGNHGLGTEPCLLIRRQRFLRRGKEPERFLR